MGAVAIVPRLLAGESMVVGFGVVCKLFSAPNVPNEGGGAGHDDAVRTAGACVSSMAGKGVLVV